MGQKIMVSRCSCLVYVADCLLKTITLSAAAFAAFKL
jgi:hypothetical protein